MYSFLRGKVAYIEDNSVALDVGGVGYKIYATEKTLSVSANSTDMMFYTSVMVKEDGISIFGFETRQEKAMFERLITVSGVGPKAAISILNGMTLGDISNAILCGDTKAFSRVNGIGPKTAARLILELKDKVDISEAVSSENALIGGATPETEAIEALMGIGYSRTEAANAVKAVSALADTAEDMTLMALKRLSL